MIKDNKITPELVEEVKNLIESGIKEAEIRRIFREKTGLKKSAANVRFVQIRDGLNKGVVEEDGLKFVSNKYVYDKDQDIYTFNLRQSVKPFILSGAKFRAIVRSFSEYGENLTIQEVARKYVIPIQIFNELKKIVGLEKTSLPITDEQLDENTTEESIEKILEDKKFNVWQGFEKESWKEIKLQSLKWQEFQYKQLDPFSRFIESWSPPDYIPYQPPLEKKGYSLVVALSDIHYGGYANDKYLLRGRKQTTEETAKDVEKYCKGIIEDIKNLNINLESVEILSLGDILNTSTPYGTTTKGTQVRFDILDEELFETAFNSLSEFVYQLSNLASKTRVISLRGNHAGVIENNLFFAMSKYFSPQSNITFDICKTDITTFQVRNMMCVAGHGASNSLKAKIGTGIKLQNQIQSYIISESHKYQNITSRSAFFGDLHTSIISQFNDFDYILFPTIVKGDVYADALGYKQQPKQQCLLVDDNGIKAILNYKF